jgi:putative spermidine/putrescine transport system permease protein
VALVLGEYTFANLMNYENLQVAIQHVSLVDANSSIAVALSALLFAFVILLVLSLVGSGQVVDRPKRDPLTRVGAWGQRT